MKLCHKCKKWKDESEFSKESSRKDGLKFWCKKCDQAYARKRYRKDMKGLKEYYSYEERHRVVDGVKQKRCNRCKRWKAESMFYRKRRHKDGLATWCAKCTREYVGKRHKVDGKSVKRYYSYEENHRVVNDVKQKRCRRCRKWKAEIKFYKMTKHKDRLATWCKECSDKATNKARKKQRSAVRN